MILMKFAFVFPGQGSQSIGMMNNYADVPAIRETFDEASDVLSQDFWSLASDGPAELLNLTVNTQPLMLTAGVAVYRCWQALGGDRPAFLAGHSLGEYTALVAGGALNFSDALELVRFRAREMQQSVPEGVGGMAAILGLEDAVIEAICQDITESADQESIEAANYNSPGQVVIAGHKSAVLKAIEMAKEKGAKRAVMLPMSIPSHCRLMKPAADKMQHQLSHTAMRSPDIPIIHNVDVQVHDNVDTIKGILTSQLYSPIRWVDTIKTLAAEGVTHIAECGPGNVLTGLNKRIDRSVQYLSFSSSDAVKKGRDVLS